MIIKANNKLTIIEEKKQWKISHEIVKKFIIFSKYSKICLLRGKVI